MTEVRALSNSIIVSDSHAIQPHDQYGLFATAAYREGDIILVESPLFIFSSSSVDNVTATTAATEKTTSGNPPSSSESVPLPSCRSLFHPNCLTTTNTATQDSLTAKDLILPQIAVTKLSNKSNAKDKIIDEARANKLRGMILALAHYSINPPSEETISKLLNLYHPSTVTANNSTENNDAIDLANLALECCEVMSIPNSALSLVLRHDLFIKRILLIYSCNAFEGGRIYDRLSRVNHSCNPNAIVLEGCNTEASSDNITSLFKTKQDVSILKAACDIAPGEEITISYLGKYLFAGYSIRQRILRANKHFICGCSRCNNDVDDTMKYSKGKKTDGQNSTTNTNSGVDMASCIPCPICHPRSGRYLDEDIMLDEDCDQEDGFKVSYAIPQNGLTPEERSLYCPCCKESISIISEDGGSMRKKKEGMAIKYMCMAEEKVYERLESIGKTDVGDDATESEQDMDRQFLQMTTSICGSRHWTTHFMNLYVMEESLASIHSTMMSNAKKDAEMMEDVYVEIAEAADGLDKAYKFASSLGLKLHPAHWLFDYTIALAQTLVGLGDEKSQKYGSSWVERVDKYSERFENERMREVVIALRDAWKTKDKCGDTAKVGGNRVIKDENGEPKRQKLG